MSNVSHIVLASLMSLPPSPTLTFGAWWETRSHDAMVLISTMRPSCNAKRAHARLWEIGRDRTDLWALPLRVVIDRNVDELCRA